MTGARLDPSTAADVAFWQGRRVLVTGHTGFKGAWLVAWLQYLGAQVTGYSLAAPAYSAPVWQALAAPLKAAGLRDLRGDIRDPAALDAAVQVADADVVFHLAAQAVVLDGYAKPEMTWDTNVLGTLQVLQAVGRHARPATVIGVTSDKCYENREWAWGYREIDSLGGHDPYSASKAACEILLSSWRRSFGTASGIRVASARAGNVIGGGDGAPHRIMPDLLGAFARGEPAQVRRPWSTRPYQHVLEPLSGYLRLARFVHQGGEMYEQAYNFGPDAGGEKQTGWLAGEAARYWGGGASAALAATTADQPHEAGVLMLDSAKARKELAWTPQWSASAAIQASVDWHKAFLQGLGEAACEVHRQIALYVAADRYAPAS